ncbi:SpoIIE family protein phosphatase [Streptomyces sp. NPDC005181]|uniref:SpoIIE family protein phosphatase n=1 Tax=Streptomyces sp. NPDC005181 TaxID=3156869 RepID=UPI0033A2D320
MSTRDDPVGCQSGPVAAQGARLVVDDHGVVVEWSSQAQALLGYSAEEVLGHQVTFLLTGPGEQVDPDASEVRGPGCGPAVRHRSGERLEVGVQVWPLVREGGAVWWSVLLARAGGSGPQNVDGAILRAVLTQSPLGLQVLDPDLRVMRFNTAGPGTRGLLSAEVIGRPAREVAPGVVDDSMERMLRDVLDTGQPVIDIEHVGRPPADPGHEHFYAVSIFRLQVRDGGVLGLLVASTDISERHRARAGLDLLIDASTRIGTTLDVMTTCEELVEAAVPRLADIAAVDILDDVLQGRAPQTGPVSVHAMLLRAAFKSTEGERAAVAYRVGEVNLSYPRSFRECLADLRPRLVQHLEIDSEWAVHDARRAELIRRTGAHSLMVVPLTARGVVLGLATFYRTATPDPFEEDSLALAAELGARAAVCIDNARRYTRERTAARILQSSLLPQAIPPQNAVDVALHQVSAAAAGDWYDVIPLSGARVALVVGHVPGHGMHAAAAMGQLRTAINTLAAQDLAPDELLADLDDLVRGPAGYSTASTGSRSSREQAIGATCVYAVYDPISRRCTLARAGHPAPLIAFPHGAVDILDTPDGPALGSGRPPYETSEPEIPEGSTLALFTNSLIQNRDSDPRYALTRLCRILSYPLPVLQDTCDAIIRAQHPATPDDVVLLLARTRALDTDQVASWTLPNDPAVVANARSLTSRQLATWGLQELDFTTQLVVSELVTNAIRYATGPIQQRLIRDRTLICEVTDDSSTAPHLRHADLADEGGRGLYLVAQLTGRWGTRFAARGKTIWAEQALP